MRYRKLDLSKYSVALGVVTGVSGTMITNGSVSESVSGRLWDLPKTVKIPANGSVQVIVTSDLPGPFTANIGDINTIATPVVGWTSFTNINSAVAGAPLGDAPRIVSGDYSFGRQGGNFYKNTPEAVAQSVLTRLLLIHGEWFLDTTIGVPYKTDVLGMGTLAKYDYVIRRTILETRGVTQLLAYSSNYNSGTRHVTITCEIDTVYGPIEITQIL